MADEEKKVEKTEEEILFPEIEVMGIKLKPWSFGQYADLAPHLKAIRQGLREDGIDLSRLRAAIPKELPREGEKVEVPTGFIDGLFDVLTCILPHLPRVFAITTGLKEEEIRRWHSSKATVVLLVMIRQNWDHLKNSFGLGMPLLKGILGGMG